jgi:V/A-type H+/Na+-transporting ATPase subunit F
MKVMVIGHPEAVMGFSLVGVQGKSAQTAEEATRALDDAFSTEDVGIILVTDDVGALIRDRMDQLKLHSTVPLVLEIPSPGEEQPNQPSITDIVFRAIGVRL